MAFPRNIGCALGGGNWNSYPRKGREKEPSYLEMIKSLAKTNTNWEITIYEFPQNAETEWDQLNHQDTELNDEATTFYKESREMVIKALWDIQFDKDQNEGTAWEEKHHEPPKVININNIKGNRRKQETIRRSVYIRRRNDNIGKISSKWANPFKVDHNRTREESLSLYKHWIIRKIIEDPCRENIMLLVSTRTMSWTNTTRHIHRRV